MKEEEIRPQRIFNEYLRLAERDTKTYFSGVDRVIGNCPACENVGEVAFEKHGFIYENCPRCFTLFVNPRPLAGTFLRYYTESPSSKYWASTFYKVTAEDRREKLWKPKARLIWDLMIKFEIPLHTTVVDIGGGFGLFGEEIRELSGRTPVIIEPGPDLAAVCRDKSLLVIQKFLEQVVPTDLPLGPKVFVCFELFEHLHDPARFLQQLKGLMTSGDLFVFTTLSSTGVDIQALWRDSKSVMPPHHLNFFNPQSVRLLLSRIGFKSLGVTTPGKLDIDILFNNRLAIRDRFWRTFVATASESVKSKWQEIIAATGWSSHLMVVCRKP